MKRAGPPDGPVLRRGQRPVRELAPGVCSERLTLDPSGRVEFILYTYEPGAESCPPDALVTHAGREYGVVLRGRLGATLGFESVELAAGDSVVLDPVVPHRLWAIGDEPCVLVWAVVDRAGDLRPSGD